MAEFLFAEAIVKELADSFLHVWKLEELVDGRPGAGVAGEQVLQCRSAFCVSMCTFVPVKQVRPGAGVAGERVLQRSSAFCASMCTFVPVKQVN